MDVRLLGTMELVDDDGHIVRISGAKRRAVLAALAIDLNRVVSTSRLLDVVWESNPPSQARTALQVHISYLRKMLTSDLQLETRPSGYMLVAERQAVDALRLRDLVSQARSSDARSAVNLLRSALGLWRGPALADVQVSELQTAAVALEEVRLGALESLAGHLIHLNKAEEVIADLTTALHLHPLRESLVRAQMLSLFSVGRQADALTLYDATRRALVEMQGVDPSPQLQAAYQLVLKNEPIVVRQVDAEVPGGGSPGTAAAPQAAPPRRAPSPAQLPRHVAGFVGRTAELDWMDKVAVEAETGDRGVMVVVGPAGVGKTSLVTRWANNVAGNYPDGQLFVNLHGFDDSNPLSIATALTALLRSLDTSEMSIPRGEEAQVALYRTIVSSRRLLIVLDNARSADQVRPLLPSGSGSLAVVTSRTRLDGLAVSEGAAILQLGSLPKKDSLDLLANMVGRTRVSANLAATKNLVDLCDNLPLALRIAGAQLAARPDRDVSDLTNDLRDEQQTLSTLSIADDELSIEASLSFTYRSLQPQAVRLFLLLGVHPGTEFDQYSCAALTGASLPQSRATLVMLSAVHLINQHREGRSREYNMHDLVRAYGRQLTAEQLDVAERDAAFARLVSYYIAVCGAARRALAGPAHPISEPDAEFAPKDIPAFESSAAASDWFAEQEAIIRALISVAHQSGRHADAWHLMDNCLVLYIFRGAAEHFLASARAAVDAATAADDPIGKMLALRALGVAYAEAFEIGEARNTFARALVIADHLPDPNIQIARGVRLLYLGVIARSDPVDIVWDEDLVTGSDIPEIPFYQAARVDYLAQIKLAINQLTGIVELIDEGLVMAKKHSIDSMHHRLLQTRGDALARVGDLSEAVKSYTDAHELAIRIGDIHVQAMCWEGLGNVHDQLGQPAEARSCWLDAIALYERLGAPERVSLRCRLDGYDAPTGVSLVR